MTMPKEHSPVYVFNTYVEAENAIHVRSDEDRATVNSVLARPITRAEAIAETVTQ